MTVDLFERYASLDPAKAPGNQPEWSTVAPVLSVVTDWRDPDMQTQQQTLTKPPKPKKIRTLLLVAAAAFALVLVVGGIALLSSGDASEPPSAATPPSTVVAEAAPEQAVTPAEAIAVANAWYVALNDGDVDAMMALYAPDATTFSNFRSDYTLEEEREFNVWNAAQGTKLTTEGCTSVEGSAPQTVHCDGATYDAPTQAVGTPPVRTSVTMTIGFEGIAALRYTLGAQPNFAYVGDPFIAWMRANNPEDTGRTIFHAWTTIEEAHEYGLAIAKYAQEWAAYLEANDCTYLDGC